MDLAALEIFRTVVEAGGVTRAAERLHRVQSNVTTRIRQLEESLGVELFLRDGKRMVLTPAGQTLFDYACRMLRLAEEARHAVLPSRPHGRLRIASMESTAASRLRRCWLPITRPGRTSSSSWSHCDPAGHRGTGALRGGLRIRRRAARQFHPGIAARVRGRTGGDCPRRAPPDPQCGGSRNRHAARLRAGLQLSRAARAWHAAGGGAPPRVLQLGSYHAIVACAAAGIGAAIVPRSVLGLYRDLPAISLHSLGKAGRVRTLLAWHPAMASAALDALLQALPAPDAPASNPPLSAAA